MLKYLLDTDIAVYVIKRRPIEVLGLFNENAGRMAISFITLSELYHGAERSAKVAQNLAVVEASASLREVLPYFREGLSALWRHSLCAGESRVTDRRQRSAHCSPRTQRGTDTGRQQPR